MVRKKSAGRKSERHKSSDQRSYQRAPVNPARGGSELLDLLLIIYALFAPVHVARPARGHSDSSLFPRLKESEASYPQGQEDDRAG